ncbi:glycerophosphodiester phosphodiesterase family protein [Haloferula sp.]|uniref:glycerophosphodiester phosphodiesterase family protein n=1 Tax=Haloferula sp. TaxID=2497595 RepID=UPI003C710802
MAPPSSRNDGLWHHYWATWRTMFAIQSVALVFGLSLAIPIISLATNRALSASGNFRLSDTDLLDFLFGPNFPLVAIAVTTLWIVIHVFGYAAQLVAARASLRGAPISAFAAIQKTSPHLLPLTQLAFRFFTQLFIIALPFLLVIVGVLSLQLQDNDLSEYLVAKPPEFILAIAFAVAIFGLMSFVLVRVTARWFYAMPLVLFSGEKPASARRLSRKKSHANRHRIFITITLWAVVTPLLVLVLNAGWLPLALRVSDLLGHRLGLLSLVLSLVVFMAFTLTIVVGFISLTILAIRHVGYFRAAGLDAEDSPTAPEPDKASLIARLLTTLVILTAVLTIGLTYRWLSDLRIADHARIVALRGASQDRPENTLSAINRAWDHGAHGIAVDVRLGSDQEVLVFADADFTRIAKLPLKIDQATRDDLAAIDIGSWMDPRFHEERVPSLDQVIGLCSEESSLMLLFPDLPDETQRRSLHIEVAKRLKQGNISGRTRIVCARPEQIPEVREHHPDAKLGFWSQRIIDGPIGVPVDFIIVPADTLRSDLIDNLHRQRIEVFAAGTSDPAMMSAVLSRGADGLLVTSPRLGRQVLEERSSLNPGERLLVDFVIRIRDALPQSRPHNSVSQ